MTPTFFALQVLPLQPPRPVGKVVALARKYVLTADRSTCLARFIYLVRAFPGSAATPQTGDCTPLMACKVEVVTELNLRCVVVGFQAFKDNFLRRGVGLIPIKLLTPFVVRAISWALRITNSPELFGGPQLRPPPLCLTEIEEVFVGYQKPGVSLRERMTATRKHQENSDEQ